MQEVKAVAILHLALDIQMDTEVIYIGYLLSFQPSRHVNLPIFAAGKCVWMRRMKIWCSATKSVNRVEPCSALVAETNQKKWGS